MSEAVLQVITTGMGMTFQDLGRPGWKRFGVPESGAMDQHAASTANQMLGNSQTATLLEVLWQGAKLRFLRNCWIATAGAVEWHVKEVKAGEMLEFKSAAAGLWIYLAVPGGFITPVILNSTSTYPRGKLGPTIGAGDRLCANDDKPSRVAVAEPRDYSAPPAIRVWPGPQSGLFSAADRETFFAQAWTVSPQSDRVGYRLTGNALSSVREQILSEPVCAGTIQLPENGQPIITMRDGPTVGGYPKLGVIEPDDLNWVAQCRPGTKIRFHEYRPEL